MKAQNIPKVPKSKLTHCVYCKSTILWNQFGKAYILKSGNNEVFECMRAGCCLIVRSIPDDLSTPEQLGSLLLTLVQDGIPSDVAESAALELISNRMAA